MAVSYTDGGGTPETVTSAGTTAVINVNDAPTGAVTISGTPMQGETLTANTSALADADGLGAFSYQWKVNGINIAGPKLNVLTLAQAEVGKVITVAVSYIDGGGTPETVTSDATTAVANVNDAPTGAVIINGTVAQGEVLTADTSTLTDADGLGAFSGNAEPCGLWALQSLRNCVSWRG